MLNEIKKCQNPGCPVEFEGRPNRKFCCDSCRWTVHAYERRGMDVTKRKPHEAKPIDYSKQGKANRAKGAREEREVCHIVNRITGSDISRNLSQTRDSGCDVTWGPFLLEVKYQKTLAIPAWQRQVTTAAAKEGLVPCIVHRRPTEDFWISLPFELFVTLFDAMRQKAGLGGGD